MAGLVAFARQARQLGGGGEWGEGWVRWCATIHLHHYHETLHSSTHSGKPVKSNVAFLRTSTTVCRHVTPSYQMTHVSRTHIAIHISSRYVAPC